MPIPSVTVANTFAQWLISTQQSITALNNLEANTYTKTAGIINITSSGTGLNVSNTANIKVLNANTIYSNNIQLSANTGTLQTIRSGVFAELKWTEASKKWQVKNVDTGSFTNIITSTDTATTSNVGIVKLVDSVSSTSTTEAATPSSVKSAYDLAFSVSNQLPSVYSNINAAYNKANTGGTLTANTTVPSFTYTGTLTGSSNILNIGSGQIYKNTSGSLGLNTTNPSAKLHVYAFNIGVPESTGTGTTGVTARFQNSTFNMDLGTYIGGACFIQARLVGDNSTKFPLTLNPIGGPVYVNNLVYFNHDDINCSVNNTKGNMLFYTPASTFYRWHVNNAEVATLYDTAFYVKTKLVPNSIGTTTASATGKTLEIGEKFFVNSGASGVTVTLPATPSAGNFVTIGVTNQTDTIISRNGSNIMGLAENMTIDKANVSVSLVYVDSSIGWKVI